VTVNGVTKQTDNSGNVIFNASPSDPVKVVTLGFRVRDTRVGSGLVTLFPLGSDYDDEFVDQLLFEPPNLGMLQQPSGTIFYEMGEELAPARAAIVAGAAIAERAFGIDFQVLGVGQAAPPGAEVFMLSIDPSLRRRGYTSLTQWTGGAYITGGTIAFVELAAAQFIPLVAHESGHAGLALGHPSVQKALMNEVVDGTLMDFTHAEKTVGRLSLQRMAGTVAPDNDVAVKSASRSKRSVGCHAIY
jgi:hypothetical protein